MDAFEVILKTGEPAELAMVKSLLESAGIPVVLDGEGVQDLFGVGRLGAGYNVLTGPVRVKVPTDRAAEARRVIDEALEAGAQADQEGQEDQHGPDSDEDPA